MPDRVYTALPYRDDHAQRDAYSQQRCVLDLTLPESPAEGFATVVWFHGGGLTENDRETPPGLLGHGIAVAGAGYRLNPGVKAPAYIEDAAAAVAWVVKHIAEYGGDPKRVYVSGHSAGAYLLALIGLDGRWLAAEGVDVNSLAGLAPLSAQVTTHFKVREERGLPSDWRATVDELAPLRYVRADAPPLLLVTGDRLHDIPGRYEENAWLYRLMKSAGHPKVSLVELQLLDHGGMVEPALLYLLRMIQADG